MTTTTTKPTAFKVLGHNHPRLDAHDKVTGRAAYAADVYLPGMLAAKLLPSARRHARIRRIDASVCEHWGVDTDLCQIARHLLAQEPMVMGRRYEYAAQP